MIDKYVKYLTYVLKHKYYVFQAGIKIGVPIWNLIWHDWDKFLPSMIYSYANYFYGKKEINGYFHKPGENDVFDLNWLQHIHRNKHHWQHFLLKEDEGNLKALNMSLMDIREMVADWKGAGMAQGNLDICAWYRKNRYKIIMSDFTKRNTELLLRTYYGYTE